MNDLTVKKYNDGTFSIVLKNVKDYNKRVTLKLDVQVASKLGIITMEYIKILQDNNGEYSRRLHRTLFNNIEDCEKSIEQIISKVTINNLLGYPRIIL